MNTLFIGHDSVVHYQLADWVTRLNVIQVQAMPGSLKGPALWDLGGPGFSSHALVVARDAFVTCLKELQADSNKTTLVDHKSRRAPA
jgi:hypothetical protein